MLVKGFFTTRRVNPSADLDEGLLNQIAKETNGQYFRARDTQQLANIYKILDELEPVDDDPIQLRPVQALFYWPLLAAIFASLAMVFGQFIMRTFKR
jgi:Ca-activated chloride channel homolog